MFKKHSVCVHMHLSQEVFLSLSWVLLAVKRECLHHLSVSKSKLIVMLYWAIMMNTDNT